MTNPIWNQQLIKKENKAVVLQLIKNNEDISRTDIAQQSGLNKGTVSSLVAELIKEQLILEKGTGESSGGRRPVLLQFNSKAGYVIGVDLGVNYILGILMDLQGEIVVRQFQYTHSSSSVDETLNTMKEMIESLIQAAPESPYGVVGIGIGAPGIVDDNSSVILAPNLGWKNSSIKTELESAFQIPVLIENEANAGAYGEKMYGLGKTAKNLVYISAAIGIGTGIIIDGALYRGAGGFSGEFGHMSIDMDGEKCRCGNIGCWELYASEQYVLNEAMKHNLIDPTYTSIQQIIELAKNNHPTAIKLLEKTAIHFGKGIVNIIHALNPQTIIIGNRLSEAKDWMMHSVQAYVNEHVMNYHQTRTEVLFSDPAFPSTALGVGAFSIEKFLDNNLERNKE